MSLEHSPQRQMKRAAAHRLPAPATHSHELPLLLTIARTAHELGISERQVYELIHQGLLDLVPVGERASRITRDSVLALAAKRTAPRPVKNFAKDPE
jgi:excisionase family DNA binding protein